MSELLNLEIVLKKVMSELVSESMPDDVLNGGWRENKKWNDGKWILEVGWVGNGTVKGSNSSAHRGLKKMIVLRLQVCGRWLFDYLFECITILRLLCNMC